LDGLDASGGFRGQMQGQVEMSAKLAEYVHILNYSKHGMEA
jgi:hypothetical protein